MVDQNAPDIAKYIQPNREFYVFLTSVSLTYVDTWYQFDGQDHAQVIQGFWAGLLKWYYRDRLSVSR